MNRSEKLYECDGKDCGVQEREVGQEGSPRGWSKVRYKYTNLHFCPKCFIINKK